MLLLVDADDTLWENNVYFERAIEQFIDFVSHQHYSRGEVRRMLDEIERANTALHGYGSAAFARNLQEAFRRLAETPISAEQVEHAAALAATIARQEMEIIDGVPETLDYLAGRHRLVLFTKGCEEEQRAKLRRSSLERFFSGTFIVREKDRDAYQRVTADLGTVPAQSWMIGNSPRSDINPALAAGLSAVWVPHSATWTLEQEELQPGSGELLVVQQFGELRQIF